MVDRDIIFLGHDGELTLAARAALRRELERLDYNPSAIAVMSAEEHYPRASLIEDMLARHHAPIVFAQVDRSGSMSDELVLRMVEETQLIISMVRDTTFVPLHDWQEHAIRSLRRSRADPAHSCKAGLIPAARRGRFKRSQRR